MNEYSASPLPLGEGEAVLAFDVGGTDMKSALFTAEGTMLGLTRTPTPLGGADTPGAVLDTAERLMSGYAERFPEVTPRSAGLLVPGLVDDVNGIGVFSSNLGWRDVPFRALAEARLGLPVAFSHDVRGAGEAEFRLGAARGARDAAVLVIGTGIAGAFFVDGRPHLAGGYAGEIGHSVVEPDGPACPCGGAGHLEMLASAGAIARRYAERSGEEPAGARDVLLRAEAGDTTAQAVWAEAVRALALGIGQVVTLMAPEVVVLGGGLAQAGPALFEPLHRELDTMLTFQRRPRLVPAQIGEDAGLIGAALRARDLLSAESTGTAQ
ncbi:MAG: ROK family protein [Cryobacterium sp.]